VGFPSKGHEDTLRLVLLYVVGYSGHVVYSDASGARNVIALFFMLDWDRYEFNKKHARRRYAKVVFFASGGICGSCSAFRCVRGTKCRLTIFLAQVGPVGFP
jgi:hypothetical protein